jgi:hypothetical protein
MAENLAVVKKIKFHENKLNYFVQLFLISKKENNKKCKNEIPVRGIEPTNEKDITRELDVLLNTRPYILAVKTLDHA